MSSTFPVALALGLPSASHFPSHLSSLRGVRRELILFSRSLSAPRIFATKLEERNIIAPDDRSRIFAHEKTGTYPWEWTLDEKELAGKPRLYQWDRYATETEPAMDPRIRVDINVPIKEVKIRKRPDGESSRFWG